jgi:hypothetical protein
LLGEALDDGRLADAGVADEQRVVLPAAREHLDRSRAIWCAKSIATFSSRVMRTWLMRPPVRG